MVNTVAKSKTNGTPTKLSEVNLVTQIIKHQEKLNDTEGSAVEIIVQIGCDLSQLKKIAKHGNWSTALEKLKYDERVARRYMSIAKNGVNQI